MYTCGWNDSLNGLIENWRTNKTKTRKGIYTCGGFFLSCENFGRMFDNWFPACAFFFFKWRLARMVASSNPGLNDGRIFFSRVNFVCWLLFGVRSTVVLPQWHVKDPGHSAKSASGRLLLNTHTPLTQRSRSGLTMPLSRHSVRKRKRAHTQHVRQHSATVFSARWATVDWSSHKRAEFVCAS